MNGGVVTVDEWSKNSRELVRATLSTFHGHRLGDVRVYLVDNDLVPTRKGLAVRVEDLPRLRESIDALIAAAEREAA